MPNQKQGLILLAFFVVCFVALAVYFVWSSFEYREQWDVFEMDGHLYRVEGDSFFRFQENWSNDR